MTEAALALSEQKNHNMGQLLTRLKTEKEEQRERQNRERKKEQEVRMDGWVDGEEERAQHISSQM